MGHRKPTDCRRRSHRRSAHRSSAPSAPADQAAHTSQRGVIMAMPVVGEARLQLEPLAGETDVHHLRVGPAVGDITEGIVDHVPGPALVLRRHPRGRPR